MRRVLSRAVAALFALAAAFHLSALVHPDISEPSTAARHAVFVVINCTYAALFYRRPRWLVWAYLPLAIQQSWSHTSAFIAARAVGHVDWQSVLALLSIPIFLSLAWAARSDGRSDERARADERDA